MVCTRACGACEGLDNIRRRRGLEVQHMLQKARARPTLAQRKRHALHVKRDTPGERLAMSRRITSPPLSQTLGHHPDAHAGACHR